MGGPVDRLRRSEGRGDQAPGVVVGPRVVRALNPPGVGTLFHEQGAAVRAQVRQRRQPARPVAQQEHGLIADPDGQLIAGLRERVFRRREHPVPVPDAFLLGGEPCRIAVRGGRQRAGRIQVTTRQGHAGAPFVNSAGLPGTTRRGAGLRVGACPDRKNSAPDSRRSPPRMPLRPRSRSGLFWSYPDYAKLRIGGQLQHTLALRPRCAPARTTTLRIITQPRPRLRAYSGTTPRSEPTPRTRSWRRRWSVELWTLERHPRRPVAPTRIL